jgi:SAM-dependent methyltransferase
VADLQRHQKEIERNRERWKSKPLLQEIYHRFYQQISLQIDRSIEGAIVEVGSGIGNLKSVFPRALATDLFPNPWIDLVCDAYELPFGKGTVSWVILFDVFHHLEFPAAFFQEAGRVLVSGGKVILFEPFISWTSHPVYGLLHPEPVGWRKQINCSTKAPFPRSYFAAQGNATRLFFGPESHPWKGDWVIERAEPFAAFSYLLSGGFSKPAFYPARLLPALLAVDRWCSRWPKIFASRCLVVLRKA